MPVSDDQRAARRIAEAQRDFLAAWEHDQAGRRDRAEALYRKVVQKAPDHADALHLLGVIAHERGRYNRAIQLIERSLTILPEFPPAHLNLGNAQRAIGQRDAAAASYRRAAELQPDYAQAHNNLAAILVEDGVFAAALKSAERALALTPDFAEAEVNRSDALVGLRRFAEAEAAFRRAVTLKPGRAETHRGLALLLAELDRFDEAIACHRRAIELDPNDPLNHHAFGLTLYGAQDLPAAEASFRQALALAPDLAQAWHGLGNLLLAQGRIDEALASFRRAVALAPDLAEAHQALAFNRQPADNKAQLDRLGALLADDHRPASARISAGFALGTFLDTAERHDEAFAAFAAANALCRRELAEGGESFDAELLEQEIDGLIERCTPALFAAAAAWGDASELPVFIVGMPRSGTSLVEQIMASHASVFGAGERKDVADISEAVQAQNRNRPVEAWDMELARSLAERHLHRLAALGGRAARVTDKMPDNLFHLGIVAVLFSKARVVFCRRDPRDTGLSCYFQRFGEGHAFAYDLSDCGRRLVATERLAEHWRRVLPLAMLTVDYEKLVAEPESESRRLIDFLGLEWEPSCLDFHRTRRPVFTASSWQVRQPIHRRSVGRWRHYERHLGPLLQVLGEPPQS